MGPTSTRHRAATRARVPALTAAVLGALVAASPARARVRAPHPSPPRVRSDAPAPPWSGTRGAPPPPPLDRAGDGVRAPAGESERGDGPRPDGMRRRAQSGHGASATGARREGQRAGPRVHVVRRGDTLWSIAAATLGEDDPASVASYWPRIYAANRDSIGDDPDVIVPGARLVLPAWRS